MDFSRFFALQLCINAVLCQTIIPSNSRYDITSMNQATLGCTLLSNGDPLIITWQKESAVPENVVTINDYYGTTIQPKWKNKIMANKTANSKETNLVFLNPTLADIGCYLCLFNIFGTGKVSGKACIEMYAKPVIMTNISYFQNCTKYLCKSFSYPPSTVTLNLSQTVSETKKLANGVVLNSVSGISSSAVTVNCSVLWNHELTSVLLYADDNKLIVTHYRSRWPIIGSLAFIITFVLLLRLKINITVFKTEMFPSVHTSQP